MKEKTKYLSLEGSNIFYNSYNYFKRSYNDLSPLNM